MLGVFFFFFNDCLQVKTNLTALPFLFTWLSPASPGADLLLSLKLTQLPAV